MGGSFQAGAITGRVELDRSPHSQALRGVVSETTESMKTVEHSMRHAAEAGSSSWKHEIHSIKEQMGRRSAFGESMEMLAGGGAIMGVSIAGEKLKEFTASILEMKKAAGEGDEKFAAMAEKFAYSIPVIGSFVEAFSNVGEIFSGEKAAMAETQAQLKSYDEDLKEHKHVMEEVREIHKKFEDSLREQHYRANTMLLSGSDLTHQEKANETDASVHKMMDDPVAKQAVDDYNAALKAWNKAQSEKPGFISKDAIRAQMESRGQKQGDWENDAMVDARVEEAFKKQSDALSEWHQGTGEKKGADSLKMKLNDAQKLMVAATTARNALAGGEWFLGAQEQTKLYFKEWAEGWSEFERGAKKAADLAADDLRELNTHNKQHGMNASDKAKDDFARSHQDLLAVDPRGFDRAMSQFEKLQDKARELSQQDTLKDLQGQLDTSKMDEWHKKIYEMDHSEMFKGDPVGLRKAHAMLEEMAKNAKDMKLDEQAKAFRESLETPAAHFARMVKDLDELRKAHKITEEEYNTGVTKAHGEAYGPRQSTGFIRADSAEEYHLRVQGQLQERGVKDAQREAVEQLKKVNTNLEKICAGVAGEVPQPGGPSMVDTGVNV